MKMLSRIFLLSLTAALPITASAQFGFLSGQGILIDDFWYENAQNTISLQATTAVPFNSLPLTDNTHALVRATYSMTHMGQGNSKSFLDFNIDLWGPDAPLAPIPPTFQFASNFYSTPNTQYNPNPIPVTTDYTLRYTPNPRVPGATINLTQTQGIWIIGGDTNGGDVDFVISMRDTSGLVEGNPVTLSGSFVIDQPNFPGFPNSAPLGFFSYEQIFGEDLEDFNLGLVSEIVFDFSVAADQDVLLYLISADVPEPRTYALMGLGLVGVFFWIRRRNRA